MFQAPAHDLAPSSPQGFKAPDHDLMAQEPPPSFLAPEQDRAAAAKERLNDPTYTPTYQEAESIWNQEQKRSLGDKAVGFGGAALSGAGAAAKELYDLGKGAVGRLGMPDGLTPTRTLGTVVEGAARGTQDLYNLGRKSFHYLADTAPGSGGDSAAKYYARLLEDRKRNAARQEVTEGKEGVLMQRAGIMPEAAELGSYVLDPTAVVPGLGLVKLGKAGKMAGRAIEKGADIVETGARAVKDVAKMPEQALKNIVPDKAVNSAALGAGAAMAQAAGVPIAQTAAVLKGTQAAAAGVEKGAQAAKHLARTHGDSRLSRLEQLSRNADAPMWLRVVSQKVDGILPEAVPSALRAGAHGAATGAAVGGVLGSLGAENAEEAGQALGAGATIGTAAGVTLSPLQKKAEILQKKRADIERTFAYMVQNGSDPDVVARLPDEVMTAISDFAPVFEGKLPVIVKDGANYNSSALPGFEGTAGFYDRANHQIVLNGDANLRRGPEETFYHEITHALELSAVANLPEIRTTIDSLVGDPSRLEAAKREYAARIVRGNETSVNRGAPLRPETDPTFQADIDAKLNELSASSTRLFNDPNHWVYSEIFAEAGLRNLKGADIRSNVIQGDTLRAKYLDFKQMMFEAMGVRFAPKKSGADTVIFANFDDVLDAPALRKLVYGYVRERNKFITGSSKSPEPKQAVSAEMVGRHAGVPIHTLPDGTKGSDFFVVDPGTGVAVPRAPKDVKRMELARAAEIEQAVGSMPPAPANDPDPTVKPRQNLAGQTVISGKKFGDWFYNLVNVSPESKANVKLMEGAIDGGQRVSMWYQAVGTGKGNQYAASLKAFRGNLQVSYREGLVFGFNVTKPGMANFNGQPMKKGGNVLALFLDLTTANKKIADWQARGKLDAAWGGDAEAFRKDLFTYLKNRSDGQPGDTGLGLDKKDALNSFTLGYNKGFEAMNKLRPDLKGDDKGGLIRTFRIDRIEGVKLIDGEPLKVDYPGMVRNLSPEGEAPKDRAKDTHSWLGADGTFFPVRLNHGEDARVLLGIKSGDSISEAWKRGFARVTYHGDDLYANLEGGGKLSPKQISALKNLAIESGKKRLIWDGGNEDRVLWSADQQFSPDGMKAKPGIENEPAFKGWFKQSKVVDETGKPQVVYHGANRVDRMGTTPQKNRATSGPMPFFTDSAKIASKYAEGKSDPGAQVESYVEWFKVKTPGSRKPVNIDQLWHSLPREEQARLLEVLPRIGEEGYNEGKGAGNYLVNDESPAGAEHFKYLMKREHRGNPIRAAVDVWLDSGTLFNREEEFLKVLEAAGIKDVQLHDPNATSAGVLPVYLSIQNPLDAQSVPPEVVTALERASRYARAKSTYGVDAWDKTTRDPRDWITALKDGIAKGENSFVWTSIPDWVTKTLKGLGYDGIKDLGGKMGGDGHGVWVPFEATQIKSATGNKGTFDSTKRSIIASPEGDENKPTAPIFYSQLQKVIDHKIQGASIPAAQLAALIRNPQSGIKAEEIKWSGIDDFLKGKQKVTKAEVLDYLKQNEIKIEEVEKGGGAESKYIPTFEDAYHQAEKQDQDDDGNWTYLHDWDDGGFRIMTIVPGKDEAAGRAGEEFVAEYVSEEGRDNQIGTFSSWEDAVEGVRSWVEEYGREVEDGTKFSEYQLPGGDNYKELLLTLPEVTGQKSKRMQDLLAFEDKHRAEINEDKLSPELNQQYLQMLKAVEADKGTPNDTPANYRSSHWDEKNVVAHVRFSERTAQGKKVLHVEEMQSDWHQDGRKKGYKDPEKDALRRKRFEENSAKIEKLLSEEENLRFEERDRGQEYYKLAHPFSADAGVYEILNTSFEDFWSAMTPEEVARADKAAMQKAAEAYRVAREKWTQNTTETQALQREQTFIERSTQGTEVPDAPFKVFHELLFKRMLRYAAEKGFDKMAWTPGDIQADRYKLSNHVDQVKYAENNQLFVAQKDGRNVVQKENVKPEDLPALVGEEVAQRLLEKGRTDSSVWTHSLSGLDLNVGGEGMRGFYDKIVPDFARKYAKKWGAKVEPIQTGEKRIIDLQQKVAEAEAAYKAAVKEVDRLFVMERPENNDWDAYNRQLDEARKRRYDTLHAAIDARDAADKAGGKNAHALWSIDITPEMKKSVLTEGQPQFSPDGDWSKNVVPPDNKTPSEAGYVYHATNLERALEIAASNKLGIFKPDHGTEQDAWPDGKTEKRSYWSPKAEVVWQFAPEDGKPVVLRTKRTEDFYREKTGDVYTRKPVPTKALEVLTKDGWKPLARQGK